MLKHVMRVGTPMDSFEQEVINYLEKKLPDTYRAFSNLEFVPPQNRHPYEYDLIILGMRMGWAIEIKGFHGAISGNATFWALSNKKVERSPIPLINTKARVLKQQLVSMSPSLSDSYYVGALVVVRDDLSRIDLNDEKRNQVVRLSQLVKRLEDEQRPHFQNNFNPQALQIACKVLDERFGPLKGQVRLGDYILEDTAVSRSRFSVTYPARHALSKYSQTMPRVFLKVYRLDPRLSEADKNDWMRMFIREADALSLLPPHPSIARCYPPFLAEDDMIVLPLEWVDGPTLKDQMPNLLQRPLHERLDIFRQLCSALEHLHHHFVYHRDVCPENIVLKNGCGVLVNFQLAKISLESALTLDTSLLNTVDWRYRAPELVTNPHKASPQTDLFSAGAVLFELVTGRCPFTKPVPIRPETRLDPPSRYACDVPREVDRLFLKLCQYDPAHRPSSAEQALALLDQG